MLNKEKKGWWAQEYQNSNQVRTHLKRLHSLFEEENECSSLSPFFWVGWVFFTAIQMTVTKLTVSRHMGR